MAFWKNSFCHCFLNKIIDIYIDIPRYKCPTIIAGEYQRPELIMILNNKLYLLELTAGYETNIDLNSKKEQNHRALMDRLAKLYKIWRALFS